MGKLIDDSIDGIKKLSFNNNEYTFWYKSKIVLSFVRQFLKEQFTDDIILSEFNKIDFVVLAENLPVEVQSTTFTRNNINHSNFEMKIQKQIEQNINTYDKCWFFFDNSYLNFLKNDITRGSKVNFDWFYKLIKNDKLKVFTINYEGNIKETFLNDFKFLNEISMTCEVGKDKDFRILDKNKFKIMKNILKGYGFTSDEIFGFEEDFGEINGVNYIEWLRKRESSERKKLYGNIMHSVSMLNPINKIFDIKGEHTKPRVYNKYGLSVLELFKIERTNNGITTCFIDTFNIAQFFPGYVRNKDEWESLRDKYITFETFKKVTSKEIKIGNIDKEEVEIRYNKKKNIRNILYEKNGFADDEINKFKIEFENDVNGGCYIQSWLVKSIRTKRQKKFGLINRSIFYVNLIDDFFKRKFIDKVIDKNTFELLKLTLVQFGFTKAINKGKNTKITYIDKYEIANLFEEYKENKEFFDSIKNKSFNSKKFWELIYSENERKPKLTKFLK